ncbi:MAG: glycosyltransferase [Clostridia bacterium]|nr:glycosyltransferase [Clostridia bacterium]
MAEKLKILETIDSFYPCIDGPISVVKNYALHLNRAEICKVAVPKAAKKQRYVDKEEFEVVRCKSWRAPEKYRFARPFSDKAFVKNIESEKFDIIHAHSPFSMARFALKTAKKQHIPVVLTIHTQYKEDFKRTTHGFKPFVAIAMRYMMKAVNAADSVWTVNEASCNVLRDYGYKGKIDVVRNGTDLKYPENAAELVEKVNSLHGLYGQKNVFIFVGRIAWYKNLALMADALKILKDNGEDFRMIVVGSGFDEVKFKEKIKELGLAGNFVFTGSVSDRTLLQGYYLRSDLFLFPSTFDTSSLVPIEAAAHKLPTLLIRGSYTAENIVDNKNGFLSDETPEAYAAKIKEIISEEGLLQKVGEEAHRSVYRSWEMVAAEVAAKYREVIADYKEKHKAEK